MSFNKGDAIFAMLVGLVLLCLAAALYQAHLSDCEDRMVITEQRLIQTVHDLEEGGVGARLYGKYGRRYDLLEAHETIKRAKGRLASCGSAPNAAQVSELLDELKAIAP